MQLDKYSPAEFESEIYKAHEHAGLFNPDNVNADSKENYAIVIPPPNVTGVLHIGHALVNTLQDILIRRSRMQGKRTLWVPGTDHAGIATQMVVDRTLRDKGISRHDIGRERFLEEVWKWKEQSGNTITRQLRSLGASLDWSRERFTMDEMLSRAVRHSFIQLYREGLIYRGNYMTNWCPQDQTAVSDLEVDHKDESGKLYYISYAVEGSDRRVTIATTRPETLLGDTALAVNPHDERYQDIIGRTAIVPLVNRPVKIIADDYCDPKFGTGIVKITPGHDRNDYQIGLRHKLETISIFNPDGSINEIYPPLTRQYRMKARKAVIAELEMQGLLVKTENHQMNVGRCQRCKSVIEPLLSLQWFCRMKEMADSLLRYVDSGELKFYPDFQTKIFREWMTNIEDWCISRQLWWGHRIPAWHCEDCEGITVSETDTVACCEHCQSTRLTAETDVLDTWFSSGLFPFSTLGWPEDTPDMRSFYPNSTLITGYDILFFWVARMLMMGVKFTGQLPFREVYLHGLIRDEMGEKMSKSKGNTIDPLIIIDEYGADTLRFTLTFLNYTGRDLKLGQDNLKNSHSFLNKLWNAAKFIAFHRERLKNISDVNSAGKEADGIFELWIRKRFSQTAGYVNQLLDGYEFHEAAAVIYNFVWLEFCDWYIEISKASLFGDDGRGPHQLNVLSEVFKDILHLMHPFVPFITEHLHQYLFPGNPEVMVSAYPSANPALIKTDTSEAEQVISAVDKIRSLRGDNQVNPSQKVPAYIVSADANLRAIFTRHQAVITLLAKAEPADVRENILNAGSMSMLPGNGWEVYIDLSALNREGGSQKLQHELKKLEERRAQLKQKLDNPDFISRAPRKVVDEANAEVTDIDSKITKIKQTLA